jgi:hypothetical protein
MNCLLCDIEHCGLECLDHDLQVAVSLLFFMASSLGVPVKLLHESVGHIVTVELKTGQLYRGKLLDGRYCHISPLEHH